MALLEIQDLHADVPGATIAELPMEFAVEAKALLEVSLEGAWGRMPRKIRQLKKELRKAGFVLMPEQGKGSHSVWRHGRYPDVRVQLSGNDGSDAKRHLEKQVDAAIILVRQRDQEKQ